MTRLDEFDKIEWHDLVQILRPDWTEERFERAWDEFVQLKARKDTAALREKLE